MCFILPYYDHDTQTELLCNVTAQILQELYWPFWGYYLEKLNINKAEVDKLVSTIYYGVTRDKDRSDVWPEA